MKLKRMLVYDPTSHKMHLSSIFLILFITSRLTLPASSGELNACDLELDFIHCNCDADRAEDATNANCFLTGGDVSKGHHVWGAIGNMTNLISLSLTCRRDRLLQHFIPQRAFKGMKSLEYLDVKMCEFKNVRPHAFANSSSILKIRLFDNLIRHPSRFSFSNMLNLEEINLGDNNLSQINRSVFVNLPKLRALYLDKNRIQLIFDEAFKELRNLEELELQFNNLSVISREIWTGLEKLKRLDIRNNLIGRLGEKLFSDLSTLQELDLANNKILSVSPTAFYGLKSLRKLVLKNNKIVELLPHTFSHLINIHHLDLRNNELETLSRGLVQHIYKSLKNESMELLIQGNRFKCDCRILWIQTLYNETQSTSVQYHLNQSECDLFQIPFEVNRARSIKNNHRNNHHGGDDSDKFPVSYHSNVTVVGIPYHPEETTTYAFESTKKILKLNPTDFKCHDYEDNYEDEEEVDQKSDEIENEIVVVENRKIISENQQQAKIAAQGKSSASSIRSSASAISNFWSQKSEHFRHFALFSLITFSIYRI